MHENGYLVLDSRTHEDLRNNQYKQQKPSVLNNENLSRDQSMPSRLWLKVENWEVNFIAHGFHNTTDENECEGNIIFLRPWSVFGSHEYLRIRVINVENFHCIKYMLSYMCLIACPSVDMDFKNLGYIGKGSTGTVDLGKKKY